MSAAPIPLSVAKPVIDEMGAAIIDIGHHIDETDSRAMAWSDELAKTLGTRAGAVEGLLALAFLRHMMGDMDGAERYLNRAEGRGASEGEADNHRLTLGMNLGYASRALAVGQRLEKAGTLSIPSSLMQTIVVGGFALTRAGMARARSAGVDVTNDPSLSQLDRIAQSAAALDWSDEQFAAVLDIAGAVLRERRLFWLELMPRMSFDKELGCVGFRFRLHATPTESSSIMSDFVRRVVGAGLESVPLTVNFVGVLSESVSAPEDERFALAA